MGGGAPDQESRKGRTGMGLFATYSRKGDPAAAARRSGGDDRREHSRLREPVRFEAVAEHVAEGRDASAACALVGRELARDGADLGEALDGLTATYARVTGGEPDLRALRALCVAWGEETLGYVHQLSCEDPLTGLATRGNLRARLSEVYRVAGQRETVASTSHALVVLDLPLLGAASPQDPFSTALWLVKLAESVRLVFPGDEVVAQVGRTRLVVVVERGTLLARRVGLLRGLIDDLGPQTLGTRVWIEGLPATDDGAGSLLDEIARG